MRAARLRSLLPLGALALAAGCGLRGSAPQVKPPAIVSAVGVEGREGAIRVSFTGNAAAGKVVSFDVLRRRDDASQRTFFEKIGSLPPGAGTREYYFTDAPPAPGAWHYRVRARLAGEPPAPALKLGGEDETFVWAEPPPAPLNAKAVPLHLAARLTWDPVESATGYRVYTADSAGNAQPEPASRGTLDRPTWTAYALEDGRPVCYVVRSVRVDPAIGAGATRTPTASQPPAPSAAEISGAAGEGLLVPQGDVGEEVRKTAASLVGEGALPGIESRNGPVVCVTPGQTEAPPAPHQLKLAVVADGVSLSWRPSAGEEVVGYHVERREKDKEIVWKRLTPEPATGVGFVDRTAQKGATYEYRVRAIDASGTEGRPTDPKTITFTP